jgi:hypothetical protein
MGRLPLAKEGWIMFYLLDEQYQYKDSLRSIV